MRSEDARQQTQASTVSRTRGDSQRTDGKQCKAAFATRDVELAEDLVRQDHSTRLRWLSPPYDMLRPWTQRPPAEAGGRRIWRERRSRLRSTRNGVYGVTRLNVPPNAWMPLPLPAVPVVTSPVPPTSGCSWL